MKIVFLGIDLAKNVFQLCGLNQAGKPVYTKRTGRKELLQTVANIPACLIGVEAMPRFTDSQVIAILMQLEARMSVAGL